MKTNSIMNKLYYGFWGGVVGLGIGLYVGTDIGEVNAESDLRMVRTYDLCQPQSTPAISFLYGNKEFKEEFPALDSLMQSSDTTKITKFLDAFAQRGGQVQETESSLRLTNEVVYK